MILLACYPNLRASEYPRFLTPASKSSQQYQEHSRDFQWFSNEEVIRAFEEGVRGPLDVLKITTTCLNSLARKPINKEAGITTESKIKNAHFLIKSIEDLKDEGVEFNEKIAGAAMKAFASTGNMTEVYRFAEKMEENLHIEINQKAYISAIKAAYYHKHFDCALYLLNAAIFAEHLPEVTYNRSNRHLDLRYFTFYGNMPDLMVRYLKNMRLALSNTTITTKPQFNIQKKIEDALQEENYRFSKSFDRSRKFYTYRIISKSR